MRQLPAAEIRTSSLDEAVELYRQRVSTVGGHVLKYSIGVTGSQFGRGEGPMEFILRDRYPGREPKAPPYKPETVKRQIAHRLKELELEYLQMDLFGAGKL